MKFEIRKAFSESDLEVGVHYNVLRKGAFPNVCPYEGKVGDNHAFMNTKDTLNPGSPIESFRGLVQFSDKGSVLLTHGDYDVYLPQDKNYKDKWELVKRK